MRLISAFLFLLPLSLFAQSSICAYYGENSRYTRNDICSYMKFESNDDAEKVVDNILRQVGLKRNFIVMECPDVENALAANLPSDIGTLRYIIYDNDFLEKVERRASSGWAATSILAHEIAHHLNGHTLEFGGSRPGKELEADEFSGFVLYKLGASLAQAQAAIATLQNERGSSTHPSKSRRLTSIAKGWRDAQRLASTTRAPRKPKPVTPKSSDPAADAKKWYDKGLASEDMKQKIEYYSRAIAIKPDYLDPYFSRGWAKYNDSDYLGSIEDLSTYIKFVPKSYKAYTQRGLAKRKLGREKEAIADYDIAISYKSTYALAYNNRGSAKNNIGDYRGAIKDADKAIELKYENMHFAYSIKGYALYKLGQNAEAIGLFSEALKIKPGYSYAKRWRKAAAEALAKE